MFVGILTGGHEQALRRSAVRGTWIKGLNETLGNNFAYTFLASAEVHHVLINESRRWGDITFLPGPSDYTSILFKVLGGIIHAVRHYVFDFFLKVDDDTYVHPLQLPWRLACLHNLNIRSLVVGYTVRDGKPVSDTRSQYFDGEFIHHTRLRQYLPYNSGAGYAISYAIARALVYMHSETGLFFSRLEDTTMGFWLSVLNTTWVDWKQHIYPYRGHGAPLFPFTQEYCCQNESSLVIVHSVAPHDMPRLHHVLMSCSDMKPTTLSV